MFRASTPVESLREVVRTVGIVLSLSWKYLNCFSPSSPSLAVTRAQAAAKAGLDGVVASGREAFVIRGASEESFLIITPGIRPEGASHDDHKRSCTPSEAIANRADYLVVGRPIIKQRDRNAAARQIISEMQEAFNSRQ